MWSFICVCITRSLNLTTTFFVVHVYYMHTLVHHEVKFNPLSPTILWYDQPFVYGNQLHCEDMRRNVSSFQHKFEKIWSNCRKVVVPSWKKTSLNIVLFKFGWHVGYVSIETSTCRCIYTYLRVLVSKFGANMPTLVVVKVHWPTDECLSQRALMPFWDMFGLRCCLYY